MRLIHVTQLTDGESHYDEDTGEYRHEEGRIPTAINADTIRAFYPRKGGKPGTRITFADGGGFAVSEAFDQVLAMVTPPTVQ